MTRFAIEEVMEGYTVMWLYRKDEAQLTNKIEEEKVK